jgi:hypothetical protein
MYSTRRAGFFALVGKFKRAFGHGGGKGGWIPVCETVSAGVHYCHFIEIFLATRHVSQAEGSPLHDGKTNPSPVGFVVHRNQLHKVIFQKAHPKLDHRVV